jgi:hypothetical protein
MAGKIFINYRRGDDPGFTGRLFDRLEDAFPPEQLFMDVDSIAPGLDFVRVLEEQVAACDIFLAVIGQNWIDARDAAGNRRLDNQGDFVRIEIESALKLGKRIIPVLVNNASMPEAHQLPPSLEPFSRRNAVRLSHDRFKADTQTLVKQLQKAREDAEASLQQREDDAARDAELADSTESYQAFLKDWPDSRHAPAFRNRLRTLRARNDPVAGSFSAWTSGAFALLAPIILFAAYVLFQNQALRKPMEDLGLILFDVDPTVPEAPLVAVIYVSLALFALGLVMLWRVRLRPGLEASFYWLGCVAAVLAILTVLPLLRFNPDLETGHFVRGDIGPWNVIVALLIAGSAVALARWRREVVSEVEVALYWLGSALALAYAVDVYGYNELPGQTSYLVNCVIALVAVAPVFFLIKPQAPPNWAEFALYGTGITALAAHASTNLSVYFQGPYVGGLAALLVGLLTAAALLGLRFAGSFRRRSSPSA